MAPEGTAGFGMRFKDYMAAARAASGADLTFATR